MEVPIPKLLANSLELRSDVTTTNDRIEELLAPDDDETRAVKETIACFKASLLDPENQGHLFEFHFGCTEDAIACDDS